MDVVPSMTMHKTVRLALSDASQVGEVRRAAVVLAADCGLDEADRGRLALVVSEAATNVVRHGGGGEILLRGLNHGGIAGPDGVEMLAIDKGRGIADMNAAMRDGYSTGGTRGSGLGAIERQSSLFDIVSAPGAGTIVLSQVWRGRPRKSAIEIGAACVPAPGERACGDDWTFDETPGGGHARIFVADGLGHGPPAEAASGDAVRVFREGVHDSVPQVLERVHQALRSSRGAAIAAVHLDVARGAIEFGGVGNIAGVVRSDVGTKSMVSHNGTAGHSARRFHSFNYDWPQGGLVILHSDGIASHWSFDRFPGLARRHPSLIAAVILRDHSRGRDDATVVVCRRAAEVTP